MRQSSLLSQFFQDRKVLQIKGSAPGVYQWLIGGVDTYSRHTLHHRGHIYSCTQRIDSQILHRIFFTLDL